MPFGDAEFAIAKPLLQIATVEIKFLLEIGFHSCSEDGGSRHLKR